MKNKIFQLLAVIAITILMPYKYCYAQSIMVSGDSDKDSILAGQQFNYNLSIRVPD